VRHGGAGSATLIGAVTLAFDGRLENLAKVLPPQMLWELDYSIQEDAYIHLLGPCHTVQGCGRAAQRCCRGGFGEEWDILVTER
jgi:hypothetical protein